MHYFSDLFSSRGRQQRPWTTKNVWFHSEPLCGGCSTRARECTAFIPFLRKPFVVVVLVLKAQRLHSGSFHKPILGDISDWLNSWGCGPSLKKEGQNVVIKELCS